jgi:hypothetical protein
MAMKSARMANKRDHPEDHSSSRRFPAPRRGTRGQLAVLVAQLGEGEDMASSAASRSSRGSPTSSQVASWPGHCAACVTGEGGEGTGCGEFVTPAPGLEESEPFTRPVMDGQRVPEVGRHHHLVACCMSTNELHATGLCTYGSHGLRRRTFGPAPGRILLGAALSRCRVAREGRTPARRSGSGRDAVLPRLPA